MRRLSNINTYGWSYGQDAVVCTVRVEDNIDADYDGKTAYQRYLPTGPIALLPLWDRYCSIVWTLPVSHAHAVVNLPKTELCNIINSAFHTPSCDIPISDEVANGSIMQKTRQYLGSFFNTFITTSLIVDPIRKPPVITEVSSKCLSFPLQFQHVNSYVASRVVLIGDAAHTIHPQAGQGLNLGLADSKMLSRLIVEDGLSSGQDYGQLSFLETYHKERYTENLAMMSTVDVVNKLFKEDKKVLSNAPFIKSEKLVTEDVQKDCNDVGKLDSGNNAFSDQHWNELRSMLFNDNENKLTQVKHLFRSVGMVSIHTLPLLKEKIAKFATGI